MKRIIYLSSRIDIKNAWSSTSIPRQGQHCPHKLEVAKCQNTDRIRTRIAKRYGQTRCWSTWAPLNPFHVFSSYLRINVIPPPRHGNESLPSCLPLWAFPRHSWLSDPIKKARGQEYIRQGSLLCNFLHSRFYVPSLLNMTLRAQQFILFLRVSSDEAALGCADIDLQQNCCTPYLSILISETHDQGTHC